MPNCSKTVEYTFDNQIQPIMRMLYTTYKTLDVVYDCNKY